MNASADALSVAQVPDDRFLELAHGAAHPVPIEQSPVWDPYDDAVPGRSPWRRLVVAAADGPVAVIAFSSFEGRGFRYLWAKHGPIWLSEQTPERERAVRRALVAYARKEAPWATFLRLHARHAASDLSELLQTVTYDHTVVVDLTRDEDAIMQSFSKRGRYKTRRTLKDEAMTVTEETGLSDEEFAELYEIYRETASRDGFGIFGADVYLTMLRSLGEHVRLFVARRHDTGENGDLTPGRAVSWVISTVYDNAGVDVYAAGNREARDTNAALRLKWHILTTLKAEGVTQYDLMGVGSDRAPQLMGVREFKQQLGEIVEVDGAWDVPVKGLRYTALTQALRLKRMLRR
ncbi:lipid II:glycine glycyltransferase FemX [Demequina zhanjiangensis]|uniref:Peptidoglycan bridge formation glycyltransferase FemA/FemB family protein n=1 Tax=Demequina zhanjiangensis TaxID=3051659 RepID=A0ABT8G3X9_9MICO|nr:peptidoglycan bridge formation glycyltransferase FemA/FemB family protein [Demequina sp. SYSU T00b26]MDN4473849.1 peptidoglycan bridge formation glycyltransferase FemA/FemB family protein [Demequina sp. SYSU T00b26]